MKKRVVILGAGVGGLSAGWMLARTGLFDVTVVEKAAVIGGMCATFKHEDMWLDYGPHKCYSTMPDVLEELKTLLGPERLTHQKKNSIYLFEQFLSYPVRLTELATRMGFKNLVSCATSFLPTLAHSLKNQEGASYEEYILKRFGKRIYQLVFQPLAEKTWGSPETLSADIAKTRLPSQNFLDVTAKMLGFKKESSLTDAAIFYYPKDGFGRIPLRMAQEIEKCGGTILTATQLLKIHWVKNHLESIDVSQKGVVKKIPFDFLISTLPFSTVLELLQAEKNRENLNLLLLANQLKYRSVFLVYLFFQRERITKDHWIFFPEKKFLFGRLSEQKNFSAAMIPDHQTALCCDFAVGETDPLWEMPDQEIVKRCVKDLQHVGIIDKNEQPTGSLVKRFPRFYPRYDLNYRETTQALYGALKKYGNFLSTGRIGFYNYNNTDHCVDMGKCIADSLAQNKKVESIWEDLEQRVQQYRIVD